VALGVVLVIVAFAAVALLKMAWTADRLPSVDCCAP
jgi:hypothetical protein